MSENHAPASGGRQPPERSLVRWDRVPAEFHYLRAAVEACGETRVESFDRADGRHVRFIDTVTPNQLDLIRSAKEEMERRGDRARIEAWCAWKPVRPRPSVLTAMWHVKGLLFLFAELDGASPGAFDDGEE